LNAHESLAFVYIFVECTLPRESPIANRVFHKRQRKLTDVINHDMKIFLTTYCITLWNPTTTSNPNNPTAGSQYL